MPLRPQPLPRLARAWLLALALAAPSARAQDCSWSVDLAGAVHRLPSLVGDGGHGVLAVTWPTSWVDHGTTTGTLRLHHVLEQGALDPALPAGGATFFTPAPGDPHRGVLVMQLVPDGTGGAWVLAMHNDPFAPKLRPYETATFRLHHVAASGAVAAGWVAGGLLLEATYGSPDYADHAGIAPDGAGGVIVAWIAPTSTLQRTYVRAQRFVTDGTPLWPGGTAGMMVSDSLRLRTSLRLAGDGVGGLALVTRTLSGTQHDLRAQLVRTNGTRAWSLAGLSVYPDLFTDSRPVAVVSDGAGGLLVEFRTDPAPPGTPTTRLQSLDADGTLQLGTFALEMGPVSTRVIPSLQAALGGFLSVHAAAGGGVAMQWLDAFGGWRWGSDANGVPAPPYARAPVVCRDGAPVFVWADPPSLFDGPPTAIHALELGPDGGPAPGWPAAGATFCGALYGHVLTDAVSPDGESLVAALGTDDYGQVEPRLLRLARRALAAPPGGPPARLDLRAPFPNPSRDGWQVGFALPHPAAVTLELLDVAGRVAARAELGTLAAGAHTTRFGAGARLAPGVYRLRLRAGAATAERRVIRVR